MIKLKLIYFLFSIKGLSSAIKELSFSTEFNLVTMLKQLKLISINVHFIAN